MPSTGNVERDRFVAGILSRKGGRYCSPPQAGRCTDCSGLVAEEYRKATGRSITGGSHEQWRDIGAHLELGADLAPGDLLFYAIPGGTRRAGNNANHVGVYVGNGYAVHALNPSDGIRESAIDSRYWKNAFLGAKRLPWQGVAPQPATTTTAAPPVTPTTPPPTVRVEVTADTPFRAVPTIELAELEKFLRTTPMADEVAAIHAALGGRTLPVAMSWKESRYGQDENALATKNPLGLLNTPGVDSPYAIGTLNVGANGVTVPLLVFRNWADAFREWARRMDDPGYKGGVYMPHGMSLRQFIRTYVAGPGPGYANGESAASVDLYLRQTVARLNRYQGIYQPDPTWDESDPGLPAPAGYASHKIEGSSKPFILPKGLPFRTYLTPRGPNRSGLPLQPPVVAVQHTTNNYDVGTGAYHHARWQANGTQGHPDGKIGVHAYVDAKEVVLALPVNEQGVHTGDWRNRQGIALELTRNPDMDRRQAEENAIAVQAAWLHMLGTDAVSSLYPHTYNAEGHCPDISVSWAEWERRVDAARRKLEGAA